MAYQEQIFTNLGQVQNPDPTQSSLLINSAQPFEVPDELTRQLKSITDSQIAKRQKEVTDFQNNLITKLTTVNRESDGISAKDLPEINKVQKEANDFIVNNPKGVAGLDLKAQLEIDNKVREVHLLAQLAKDREKTVKSYRDLMAKNPEYQNEIMEDRIKKIENAPLKEYPNLAFTPIANPDGDISKFISTIMNKFKTDGEISVQPILDKDGNPTGQMQSTQQISFDTRAIKDLIPKEYANFYKLQYQIMPDEKKQLLVEQGITNEDEYYNSVLESKMPYPTIDRRIIPDVIQRQQFQVERQEDAQTYQDDQRQKREAAAAQRQKERLEAKQSLSNYKTIAPIVDNISDFDKPENILYSVDVKSNKKIVDSFGLKVGNLEYIAEISPTVINDKITTKLYAGGASRHGDAYGKLFKIKAGGEVFYTPAITVYVSEGKPISKEEYNRINREGVDEAFKKVIPDLSQKFTKETLIQNTVTGDATGSNEYMRWKQANSTDANDLLSEDEFVDEEVVTNETFAPQPTKQNPAPSTKKDWSKYKRK